MMPDAILIFCLLALAGLSAIGLFALTGSVPRHGGIQPASTGNPPPVMPPYSPPIMTPLFAVGSYTTDAPEPGTHTTLSMPTFDGIICDGHDAKLRGASL